MNPQKISITVITLNEEINIGRCLQSVRWADEIIVVDSGSKDQTIEIAQSYGAKVIHQEWLGFGPQKQFAVHQATYDWILSLDADEWLSDELIKEIQQELLAPKGNVYKIPRCNIFMGRPLRYGMGYPNLVLRLFNRNFAHWNNKLVHENLTTKVPPLTLKNDIIHKDCKSVHSLVEKHNHYTSIEASSANSTTRISILYRLLLKPIKNFFKYYIIKQGFRDGAEGLIHILFMSFFQELFYIKVLENKKYQMRNM